MIQAMVIILAFTLPFVALFRSVLGKRVQALMRKTSQLADSTLATSGEAREVAATTKPRLIRLDGESIPAEADKARHAETRHSRSLFRRWWLYDAVGVASVFALWQLFFWSVGGELSNLSGINWVLLGYLIVISLRYTVYAGQYKDRAIRGAKHPGWIRRWLTVAIEQMFRALFHPRYSWILLLFLARVLYAGTATFFAAEIWVSLMVIVPMTLRLHIDRLAQKGPNLKLLILRVFGKDNSTILTFGALRNYWQHIGSTFTVVDPAYLRYKYRGHSEDHVSIVFFSGIAVAQVFGTPEFNAWWGIAIALSIIIILGYLVTTVVMYIQAPRSFAGNIPQMQDRLQRFMRRLRRLDLTFKDLDMYCFANTWRDAVALFVTSTDVVLMDLRGYSEQNKGCEYEVDFLFDNLTINRIVFLVDRDNDMQAVEKLILERWEHLKVGSPNLAVPDPVAAVYDIKDQSSADVKGLINILVAEATGKHSEF